MTKKNESPINVEQLTNLLDYRGGTGKEHWLPPAGDQRSTGEGTGVCIRSTVSTQPVSSTSQTCRYVST